MSNGFLSHLDWLTETDEVVTTSCGLKVEIWELKHDEDDAILSAWALHFRRHYCSDEDLPLLVDGTGMSNSDFLLKIKFPDQLEAPGPSIRSGDFAEILVADYLEYVRGYWCPREFRYDHKDVRNESTKGCDIIGFKLMSADVHKPDDELFIFEAKARMSGKAENRLQDAVNDSVKDALREAQSINGLKQRFIDRKDLQNARRVQRFQNEADRPFKRISGAAAVLSDEAYDSASLSKTDALHHPNYTNLRLIAIRGKSLMKLIHALYERAAHEA